MKSKRWLIFGLVASLLFAWWQLGLSARRAQMAARAIMAKDEAGGDVQSDLNNLKAYVSRHMNASVELELSGSYRRDVERAQTAAQPPVDHSLYEEATRACQSRPGSVAQAHCQREYLAARLKPVAANPVVLPDQANYRRSYVAPVWTPDLAGLSLVLSLVLLTSLSWRLIRHH